MELRRFARSASVYALAGIALKALTLLTAPIYTRFLSVEDFGAVNLADSLAGVVAVVVGVSLPQALNRLYFKRTDDASRESFVATVLVGCAAILAAGFGLSLVVGPWLTDLASSWLSVPFFPFIAIALGTQLLNQLIQLWQRLFQAEEKPRAFAVSRIVQGGVTAVAVIAFVVGVRTGGVGLLLGRLAGAAVLVVGMVWLLRGRLRAPLRAEHLREALRFGAPLIPYQLTVMALEVSDRFVIEAVHGSERVGVYSLAAMLGGVMIFVNRSVVAAWHPMFYRRVETPEGRAKIGRDTASVLQVTSAIAVFGSLIAEDVVGIMFDARYAESAALVPWIIGGFFLWEIFALANLQILEKERGGVSSAIAVTSGALNVGLNLWLVPIYGIRAAAITTFVAYAAQALLGLVVAQRVRSIPHAWGKGALSVGLFVLALWVTQTPWGSPVVGWGARAAVLGASGVSAWLSIRGLRRR